MGIGARISALLREKNFSQAELARGVGVSGNAVSKWVLNDFMPSGENLVAICRFLGVNPEDLLHEDSGAPPVQEASPAKSEMQSLIEEINKSDNKEELAKSLLAVIKATKKK